MIGSTFLQDLADGAAEMGILLDSTARKRFHLFYEELVRWNRRINLVSRNEPDWTRAHFLDSLAPIALGLISGQERIVDLGAGAGFPGIPMKVVRPGITLCLAEASSRKCIWLRHLVRSLALEETEVFEGRFDDPAGLEELKTFALAVSRAAASPMKIVRQAESLLVRGGRLLIYTARDLVDNSKGRIYPYRVPGSKKSSVIWEITY